MPRLQWQMPRAASWAVHTWKDAGVPLPPSSELVSFAPAWTARLEPSSQGARCPTCPCGPMHSTPCSPLSLQTVSGRTPALPQALHLA